MALVDRVRNVLLTPKTEWPVIAGESPTAQSLYVGYILILAAIGPIAMALRGGIVGFGIGIAVASYAITLVMTYLGALIVDALAPTFGGEKNFTGFSGEEFLQLPPEVVRVVIRITPLRIAGSAAG